MSWLSDIVMRQRYPFLVFVFLSLSSLAIAEEFPFLGEVTGEGVNIRAGQSSSFEKIGQLKTGDQVVVLAKDYGWYKIKLPLDVKAYINSKFIQELDEKTGEVTGERVNIRSGIGGDFPVLGQADKGQYVHIVKKSEDWYQVAPPDQSFGWITEGFIKFHSQAIPPARVVEAPIRNIYAKKRAAEAEKAAAAQAAQVAVSPVAPAVSDIVVTTENKPVVAKIIVPTMFMTGVVEDLAEKSLAKDIRYVTTDDKGTAYYLKAPPEVMEIFHHRQVSLEGVPQTDITAPHPVVLITKINLVL